MNNMSLPQEGNHKVWHDVHIYHPPRYHTKYSKIGIQDHKAIMNKVASLPWFIHNHDTRTRHTTSIQVSTKRKGKLTIHVYKVFQVPFETVWKTIFS
jgi:hypothetical protein